MNKEVHSITNTNVRIVIYLLALVAQSVDAVNTDDENEEDAVSPMCRRCRCALVNISCLRSPPVRGLESERAKENKTRSRGPRQVGIFSLHMESYYFFFFFL